MSVCGVNMWNDIPEEFKERRTYNQCKRYVFGQTNFNLDTRHLKTVVCCQLFILYIFSSFSIFLAHPVRGSLCNFM